MAWLKKLTGKVCVFELQWQKDQVKFQCQLPFLLNNHGKAFKKERAQLTRSYMVLLHNYHCGLEGNTRFNHDLDSAEIFWQSNNIVHLENYGIGTA